MSLLLPSLTKSKDKAKEIACASLMRQYGLATQYYVNDWKFYPDAQNYLQKASAFLNYFDKTKEVWPENIVRCPGDDKTLELGRLAECAQGTVNVRVSIGVNGNNCSDSRSMRSTGPTPYWIKPEDLKMAQPTDVAFWMDFQYQGLDYPTQGETYPLTSPVMVKASASSLNRYAFRHNNAMNSSFLDNHVGRIRLKKNTINYGHDFAPGLSWTKNPSHVLLPFGARPANASIKFLPLGYFPDSVDVSFR